MLQQRGHELKDFRRSINAKAKRKRNANDHPVAIVQRLLIEQLDARMVIAAKTVTVAPPAPAAGWSPSGR